MSYLYESYTCNPVEILQTERLELRPYETEDAGDYLKVILENKERLSEVLKERLQLIKLPEDARFQIDQNIIDREHNKKFTFGIWEKQNDNYLGEVSLNNIDHRTQKTEISFYLDKKAEGQGFATEALNEVVKYAFETLELNKVYFRCATENTKAEMLASRCGFLKEGLLRSDLNIGTSNLIDTFYFGILKTDRSKHLI